MKMFMRFVNLQLQFKQEEEESTMSSFLTPLKQNNPTGNRLQPSHNSTRQGDWVCLHCHNLNFSFRKKCNRCKVQTKEDNQLQNSYYFSYQHYYYEPLKENFPSLTDPQTPRSPQPLPFSPRSIQTPEGTPKKTAQRQELPSVSPLVKRWQGRGCESTEQSKRGGLFQNESTWANINLNYFQEEPYRKEVDQKGESEEQLEKIIENIFL